MWNQRPSFRFEIDNFSKKESSVKSQTFVGGGCEWYLYVYPKGNSSANHLSLYLHVANPKSLRTGWKRKANYYFVVLDQSNKELYKSPIGPKHTNNLYCAEAVSWGYRKTLPLCKLHEKGCLENDKLIIEVYINVLEALDGEDEDVSEKKETVDINGFQAFASQVRNKFAEHVVQTDYKNVLSNAYTKFSELAEEGFKLDWLKSKLDEVSLKKKKKKEDDESRVQLLEERIKNLEVMESGSKMDCLKSKLEEISLERKKPYDAYGYCVQKLEERVKNLEEDPMERKKSDDADRSRIEQLEVRIKDLERMMACQKVELGSKLEFLKSKFEEDSLERKKSHDADGSRIQELEEFLEGHVQNMELVVSDLKDELDKKKDKTSAHGFLLVG